MTRHIILLTVAGSLAVLAALSAGCGAVGGADVYLENVNIGSVSMAGKPVSGLPTQTINIILRTGANKIVVSQADGKTTIKLQPSSAIITSDANGLTFTGVEASQIELKLQGTETK